MRDNSPLRLTPLERALVRLTVWGHTDAQVAGVLRVSPSEAQAARERLQARLGVASRRALIARALACRWV